VVVPGEVSPAPDGEADIGALVAGRIASIHAVEGDTVSKGQVLAWLDAPELGSVRGDLARAGAQTAAAQQRLTRQLALQTQGATSQSAVDEARAAVLSAEADQAAARAKLGSIGVGTGGSSGRLAMRSPIDGIVVERHATLGGSVAPDVTLFRVIDPNELRVKARWSETLGSIPAIGTRVHLSPRRGSGGAPCEGVIESQAGLIDAATRSVTVQIRPSDACPPFTSGAYIDVLLPSGRGPAAAHADVTRAPQAEATASSPELTAAPPAALGWVQVPLEAVVDLRGIATVFVAQGEPGEFVARPVEVGPSIGPIIPITLGLQPGEKVAVKGVVLLKGEALADILGGD
jgi:membrane fusion protein, heavy metal efflux system